MCVGFPYGQQIEYFFLGPEWGLATLHRRNYISNVRRKHQVNMASDII